ncbi:MAG: DUF402 domain-containing protein [Deinococcus sp.]
MHEVRVHTLDLRGGTIVLDGKHFRFLARHELTQAGLHYANEVPDHPQLVHVETHALPSLDLLISRFTHRPGSPSAPRFYLDMASVQPGEAVWTTRDLYLDVVIETGGTPRLLDADEYAEAVLEGHLSPDEQRRALLSASRAVNGLFAHGDLDAWLASLGVRLAWWGPGERASADPTLPR